MWIAWSHQKLLLDMVKQGDETRSGFAGHEPRMPGSNRRPDPTGSDAGFTPAPRWGHGP
jgi:hypothetical protein